MASQLSAKLKTALAGKTLPKRPPRQVHHLKELSPEDLIQITYPTEPARLPGGFGAEVLSVSEDAKFANIQFLFDGKLPARGVLKQSQKQIVDAAQERPVSVAFASAAEEERMKGWKAALKEHLEEPRLGDIMAFGYPAGEDAETQWDKGVWIGSLAAIKKDKEGTLYRAVFYMWGKEPEDWIREFLIRREKDGSWTDAASHFPLYMARRATPAEQKRFEESRNAVARERAIPNAPQPRRRS
jgi:hypothetical protein